MSRRRRRFSDVASVGRSALVPFDPSETPDQRHERRLKANLERYDDLRDWCKQRGIQCCLSNNGHHWRFVRLNTLVEYWPSTAKLVVGKRYDRGVHCHDWEQLRSQLKRVFGVE